MVFIRNIENNVLNLYKKYNFISKKLIIDNLGGQAYNKILNNGGIKELCLKLNIPINKNRNISKEEIENELIKVFDIIKRNNLKFNKSNWVKYSQIKCKPIDRIYGNFNNFINSYDYIVEYNNTLLITKDIVTNDIINCYELSIELNEKFNIRFYNKHSKYQYYIKKYYGSFQKAIWDLNLKNKFIKPPTKIELDDEIKRIYHLYNFFSLKLFIEKSKYSGQGIKFIYLYYESTQNMLEQLNIPAQYKKNVSCMYAIEVIKNILNEEPYYEYTFDWLKNPKTNFNLRVDAYFKKNNIAVEYNGQQHYIYNRYFHKTVYDFNKYVNNYNLKKELLKINNVKLLEIKYDDKLDENILRNKIMKL